MGNIGEERERIVVLPAREPERENVPAPPAPAQPARPEPEPLPR